MKCHLVLPDGTAAKYGLDHLSFFLSERWQSG
jgi:hypothetical protein